MLALLKLLKLVPLKAWIGLAVIAALGALLWHDNHQTHRANRLAHEKAIALEDLEQARVDFDAYKITAAADLKLSRDTSHELQSRLSAIEHERRDRPPGLRCRPARLPGSGAESGSAAGADGAGAGREPAEAAEDFDPVPAVWDYGTDCAAIGAKLELLQRFEAARTH